MVRWVEEGVAPAQVIGVKYKDDTQANGIAFTRPICKVPISLSLVYGGCRADMCVLLVPNYSAFPGRRPEQREQLLLCVM